MINLQAHGCSPEHECDPLEEGGSARLEQHLLNAHRHQTLHVRHPDNQLIEYRNQFHRSDDQTRQ